MLFPVERIISLKKGIGDNLVHKLKESLRMGGITNLSRKFLDIQRLGPNKRAILSLKKVPGINAESIKLLKGIGVQSLAGLAKETPEELCKILGAPEAEIREWIKHA